IPVALELARLFTGCLPRVQNRCVVELGKGVDEELPVAADVRPVLVHLGHLAEWVTFNAGAQFSEVVLHGRGVVGIEIDEDETLPDLGLDRSETEVRFVEVEELRLLLDEIQRAVEIVTPAVILTGELATGSACLFTWEVVPDKLVA